VSSSGYAVMGKALSMSSIRVLCLLSVVLYPASGMLPASAGPIGVTTLQPVARAERAYRRGAERLAQGDLHAAEAAFQEAAHHAPKAVPLLLGLATVALKHGDTTQAETYLRQALTVAPQSVAAQTAWGRYLSMQQRF